MSKPPSIDKGLWMRVLTSKHIQGLAWKIEQATKAGEEARGLVKMLVEKWAELVHVHTYFPDLVDVFTPEDVFRIEYAFRIQQAAGKGSSAAHLYWILCYISNRVARHKDTIEQLHRAYNKCVQRTEEVRTILPLFEVREEDGRGDRYSKACLYIPAEIAAQAVEPKKKRVGARTKTARLIESYLTLEPKLSIAEDGTLKITE